MFLSSDQTFPPPPKDKELTDLRQERDKLEVLVRSSQMLPTPDQHQTTGLLPLAYFGPQATGTVPTSAQSTCAGTSVLMQPKRQLASEETPPPPKRAHSSPEVQKQPIAVKSGSEMSSSFLVSFPSVHTIFSITSATSKFTANEIMPETSSTWSSDSCDFRAFPW